MAEARFHVESEEAAAELLLRVLTHARTADSIYRFGPTSLPMILKIGFFLSGEIEEIVAKIERLSGVLKEESSDH